MTEYDGRPRQSKVFNVSQSGPQKVVALHDPSRAHVGDPSASDLRSPMYQQNCWRFLHRVMSDGLDHGPFRLLMFVYDMTTGWGRSEATLSYRTIQTGDARQPGTGMSKTMAWRYLSVLETAQMIVIERVAGGEMKMSINYHWDKSMLPVPKRLQQSGKQVEEGWDTGFTSETTPVSHTKRPPLQKRNHIKEEPLEEFSGERGVDGKPSHAPVSDIFSSLPVSKKQRQRTGQSSPEPSRSLGSEQLPSTSPEKFLSPRSGAAPLSHADGSTNFDPDQFNADRRAARKDVAKVLKPGALEATFRRTFEETWAGEGVLFVPWSKRQHAKVKSCFIRDPGADPQVIHDKFAGIVMNWSNIIAENFGWMKRDPAPRAPDIDFMCRHWRSFDTAWAKRAHNAYIAGLTDIDQKTYRELTSQQGLTHDAALVEIAKAHAKHEMRDENRKVRDDAKRRLEIARLEAARATPKYGPHNPHPDSPEEKRKRLAALGEKNRRWAEEQGVKPLGPDDPLPDLTIFANVEFRDECK